MMLDVYVLDFEIIGKIAFFLGALTSLGIISRLFAFIFSKLEMKLEKRCVIADFLTMYIAVIISIVFTDKPILPYVIGSLLWLAYDLQRVHHWIHKFLKLFSQTGSTQLNTDENWQVTEKMKIFDLVRVAVSMALIISLDSNEGHYEDFFKIICLTTFGACTYAAYLAIRQKKYGWVWALAIIAIIYQPFWSSRYGMFQIEYRLFLNIIASLVLLLSVWAIGNHKKTHDL